VIPLVPEFVVPQDGHDKQDCENAIAKLYFVALGQMITNPDFSLTGRNRRPPKDPVNSLLSFGYPLPFNNVMKFAFGRRS
jgi:CRISPR/Cas system-associated endonuclease Cas1